jgi:hypothetical protein
MNRPLVAALASLLCAIPAELFAKGQTTKITIRSLYLKAPVEIVDPVILAKFAFAQNPPVEKRLLKMTLDDKQNFTYFQAEKRSSISGGSPFTAFST